MDRPYVIINCAMSADGKLSLPSGGQTNISTQEDFVQTHRLRAECDSILVGVGTILSDDSKLLIKRSLVAEGVDPVRVVLDTHLRTPVDAQVTTGDTRTIIIASEKTVVNKTYPDNVDIWQVPETEDGHVDIAVALDRLKREGINSMMVEGGGTVIWSFVHGGLFDELRVFVRSFIIGGATSPSMAAGPGARSMDDVPELELVSVRQVERGYVVVYKPLHV